MLCGVGEISNKSITTTNNQSGAAVKFMKARQHAKDTFSN